jgi:predicted secreted protein
MTISAAIVLFAVIWFMTLFIVLPIKLKSQQDAGDIVEGTHASAPSDPQLKKRAIWVSIIAVIIWAPVVYAISTGLLSLETISYGGISRTYDE